MNTDVDICFMTEQFEELLEALKYIYFKHNRKNISIYQINDDINNYINMTPSEANRDFEQDSYIIEYNPFDH